MMESHYLFRSWRSIGPLAPELFVDAGVSGSVPLADRPQGKRLLEVVEKGDVIVTAKLDRAFRSAADALGTLEEMKDQGVALHMIDLGGTSAKPSPMNSRSSLAL
jgi:DNA invertase Pin-like site-specific DNA recombinase